LSKVSKICSLLTSWLDICASLFMICPDIEERSFYDLRTGGEGKIWTADRFSLGIGTQGDELVLFSSELALA
jgi:hypothetical protein